MPKTNGGPRRRARRYANSRAPVAFQALPNEEAGYQEEECHKEEIGPGAEYVEADEVMRVDDRKVRQEKGGLSKAKRPRGQRPQIGDYGVRCDHEDGRRRRANC